MSQRQTRRGFDPEDARAFSSGAMVRLISACREIEFLLDRGYPAGPVLEFIGGHHQLTARQRLALQRAAAPGLLAEARRSCALPWSEAGWGLLLIDGFNLVITLEVALSGSILVLGSDGAFRDLAGLRGTYRLLPQTDKALQIIGETLQILAVPEVLFYLDAPVSNSGRLSSRILEISDGWGMPVKVELVPDADRYLAGKSRIVTSDSLLLDQCISWFNLAARIIRDDIPDAWIIDFTSAGRCPA